MDTPDLAAFVAVADERSFSRAAEGLRLTQSAVSRRVGQLEARLGVRLFDRIGRTVEPTEAGRRLLPRARRILADLDDARTEIRDLAGRIAGPLTLATSHHVGLHRLPPVLRAFSRAHPEVRLDLRFLDSEAAHHDLLHGQLEVAVVTLAPTGVPPLESHPVWTDPLRFAVGPDHPLAGRRRVRLDELAPLPAVLPGEGTYTGRIVTGLFEAAALRLAHTQTTNFLETIRMMAGIGLGWTVLPASMIEAPLHTLTVTGAPPLSRTLGWVRHPDRTPSNAARAFLAVLERYGDQPAAGASNAELSRWSAGSGSGSGRAGAADGP